jgi:predicted dehydrogenase
MTSHDLDLIRWYLGAEPETAIALESSGVLKGRSIEVHDGFHSLVRFTDGTLVNFHGAWIHPNTYPAVADGYLEIIGTEGVVSYRRRQREATLHTPAKAQTITFSGPATASEQNGRLLGAMVDSLRLFIESVQERREPMTSGADNLSAVACQVAIMASAHTGGTPVPVHP